MISGNNNNCTNKYDNNSVFTIIVDDNNNNETIMIIMMNMIPERMIDKKVHFLNGYLWRKKKQRNNPVNSRNKHFIFFPSRNFLYLPFSHLQYTHTYQFMIAMKKLIEYYRLKIQSFFSYQTKESFFIYHQIPEI